MTVNGESSQVLLRPRYFDRQVVTASDLTGGQEYLLDRLRRHNRYLHGCGVVCGLEVFLNPPEAGTPSVSITPGYALSPEGDEIYLGDEQDVALDCITDATGDCTNLEAVPQGQRVYVAIRYAEDQVKPVPALPDACAPVPVCEFSRYRSNFEIRCFDHLPDTCALEEIDCDTVMENLIQARPTPPASRDDIPDLFACPPEPEGPWVVLACVNVGVEGDLTLDYAPRRQVLSVQMLNEMVRCLTATAPTRFQVYLDRAGEYRWRLLAGLDEIIADSGEGYESRVELKSDLRRIQLEGPDAAIEDITADAADTNRTDTRFQVYVDRAGEYRWRLLIGADEIIGDSGEGYDTRAEHDRDLMRVKTQVGGAFIEDLS